MCFFFKLHSQFKCILKPSLLLLALQITSSLPLNTSVASQQVFPLCPSHHVFFVQWNIWSKSLQSEMGWCHWSNPPMYSHMAQTRGWSLYNHPRGPLGPSATPLSDLFSYNPTTIQSTLAFLVSGLFFTHCGLCSWDQGPDCFLHPDPVASSYSLISHLLEGSK